MSDLCAPEIVQLHTNVPCQKPVFIRVLVDYFVLGCTRVTWEMSSHFREPAPWIFQLQEAESDVLTANWANVGSPVTNTFLAIDPSQEYCGKENTAFYRVSVTSALGNTYYSDPVQASGTLTYKNWHFAVELARKEGIRLRRLGVGQDGFLLKAKRSGTPCPVCLDPRTGEVTDSNCTVCFGQRWEGGFYPAIPAYYGDIPPPSRYLEREVESGQGMVNVRISEGIFLALPFIASMDVFVSKTSGMRFQIHRIDTLTHVQGVPVISKAEVRLIPTDSVIYQVPVPGDPDHA